MTSYLHSFAWLKHVDDFIFMCGKNDTWLLHNNISWTNDEKIHLRFLWMHRYIARASNNCFTFSSLMFGHTGWCFPMQSHEGKFNCLASNSCLRNYRRFSGTRNGFLLPLHEIQYSLRTRLTFFLSHFETSTKTWMDE